METGRVTLIDLPTFKDERGSLTVYEKEPFDLRRVFWVYGMETWRGGHAHAYCHQIIVPMQGELTIKLEDDIVYLSDPSKGLYVPPGNRVEVFGPGIGLVLCSEYFNEDDYID